jgi:hypothetical protein
MSEISQSSTQQSNTVTSQGIAERRNQEAERCPAGYERVNGSCRQSTSAIPPQTSIGYGAEPIYMTKPIVDAGVHPAVWMQGFGDYEKQTLAFVASRPSVEPGGGSTPMNTTIGSKTTTWGIMSGADLTFRSISAGEGILIAGVLAGYSESDASLNASGITTNPATARNGFSATHSHLSGPSAGAYATYFSGPFSSDLTFKVDFLRVNENFSEMFIFNNMTDTPLAFAGASSARVNNLSTIGNFYYKFPIYGGMWIEPTIGFDYIYSLYDAAAASLGLSNGYVLRLQSGARLGSDFFWNGAHVTTTITALAYDDVKVVGGPIVNGAFVGGTLPLADEGKIRGEGIFAMNFDYGNGFAPFVQGVVFGGEDLIGAGGKVGIRYQW